jgi:DNA-binding IclR family transcriptional regulator
MDSNSQYNIRAAERTLKILQLFKDTNTGFTLTELSMLSGLNKSTVLRFANTLKENNFLKYNEENKKYTLGFMMFILGNAAFESLDIRKFAAPYLEEASNKTNLISHLGILDGSHVLIVNKIWPAEKKDFIKMVSEVGGIVPAHCTGVGKVLLSGKSDEYIKSIFKDQVFKIYSEHTAKNVDELLDKIHKVRVNGYAVNFGEHEPYIKCITYPVYDVKNEITAAVSLTGLIEEYKKLDEDFIHSILKDTTLNISRQLGYRKI